MTWMNLSQAAEYLPPSPSGQRRSRRWLAREITTGKLRAAQIGGRGEYVTCDAWLDEYLQQQSKPVIVSRRQAG